VSVTGITNLNGLITAHVTAQNATPGSKTVNLRVTNPALQMDVGALTVNVVTTSQPLTLSEVSDLTVGATPDQCSAVVKYALPEASGGDCGGTVTTVCAPGPGFAFPLGTTTVNCTATDGLGGQATTSFEVNVVDYQAPTFTNLNNLVINAAPGECTATVNYNIQAVDSCANVTVVTDPPSGSVFPAGVTTVTAIATDAAGNTAAGSFTVTVNGNCCGGAPAINVVSATPSTLWPPNHKMRDVAVNYSVTPGCGGPVTCALSVTSNEPVNGLGDGDTAPDWQIIDAHHVKLRAERSGAGSGRIYTITITCTNSAGQSTTQSVTVTVPLNQ
jgi:hypothetical protein